MPDEQYQPPYVISEQVTNLVAEIAELVSSIVVTEAMNTNPELRRENRIKTIHSSLAIENNSLSLSQVTAIIEGKKVLGPLKEIREVENAYTTYNQLLSFDPYSIDDLLQAHRLLMEDLVKEAGRFRSGGVGVFAGEDLVHMAPPPHMVPDLTENLISWAKTATVHPLIKSCVFHYEFEFIHPFADGNGRMGRMWQTLLLYQWKRIFAWLPVESLIKERQTAYYESIRSSTKANNAVYFIEFLLQAIKDTLQEAVSTAQVSTQVTVQVRLLLDKLGNETLSAKELMARVGLKQRQNFYQRYLLPALELNMIEMTIPDKPNSSQQRYRKIRK